MVFLYEDVHLLFYRIITVFDNFYKTAQSCIHPTYDQR
ncbi:hypothetical protein BVRB_5g109580 [Beta vulgaris subsp. vulgaris]|nr:hypothetical protein BVRB_5g109580 [Beta vulgaris subsp. vulgaris]